VKVALGQNVTEKSPVLYLGHEAVRAAPVGHLLQGKDLPVALGIGLQQGALDRAKVLLLARCGWRLPDGQAKARAQRTGESDAAGTWGKSR
jgi:hypothetical protein